MALVNSMIEGVATIIEWEQMLAEGKSIESLLPKDTTQEDEKEPLKKTEQKKTIKKKKRRTRSFKRQPKGAHFKETLKALVAVKVSSCWPKGFST